MRDMNKRRNHLLTSAGGGYRSNVIQLKLHGKLITGPRLVPNELPGALSSGGPTMSDVKQV